MHESIGDISRLIDPRNFLFTTKSLFLWIDLILSNLIYHLDFESFSCRFECLIFEIVFGQIKPIWSSSIRLARRSSQTKWKKKKWNRLGGWRSLWRGVCATFRKLVIGTCCPMQWHLCHFILLLSILHSINFVWVRHSLSFILHFNHFRA